jgi:hypothetical protein
LSLGWEVLAGLTAGHLLLSHRKRANIPMVKQ